MSTNEFNIIKDKEIICGNKEHRNGREMRFGYHYIHRYAMHVFFLRY